MTVRPPSADRQRAVAAIKALPFRLSRWNVTIGPEDGTPFGHASQLRLWSTRLWNAFRFAQRNLLHEGHGSRGNDPRKKAFCPASDGSSPASDRARKY